MISPNSKDPAGASLPYRADWPQRYSANYPRYLARGGQVRLPEDIAGFVAFGMNQGDMARFSFFCLAFDQIVKEGIRGDFAELGVYKGNTASLLAGFARRLGSTVYLLDTFEGFHGQDIAGIDATAKLESFRDTSLGAVRDLVGETNVRYVKGHFPGTASQLPKDGQYCFVHLDCDLHAPMASALEYFYPRLVPGGFLVAHDYSSLHWNGAEKAVDQFFATKSECVIPLPDNAGSVAVRKVRSALLGRNWLDRRRHSLLGPEWIEAANDKLTDLLGDGWSGAETWGVWGVGERHIVYIPVTPQEEEIALELDTSAGIVGTRTAQTIDILACGERFETWSFTKDVNRAIRRIVVPPHLVKLARGEGSAVGIEFRPSSVQRTCDIISGSQDTRAVGLGLHRLRLAK